MFGFAGLRTRTVVLKGRFGALSPETPALVSLNVDLPELIEWRDPMIYGALSTSEFLGATHPMCETRGKIKNNAKAAREKKCIAKSTS